LRATTIVLGLSFSCAAGDVGPYTVTATGQSEVMIPNGADVNNVGQIPVWQAQGPYIYQNGTLAPAGYPVPSNSPAVINNLGHVAVTSGSAPYIWTGGPSATKLPVPAPFAFGAAFDLNDHDIVVGLAWHQEDGPGRYRAEMWQNNTLVDVCPPGASSDARGINNENQIVGQWMGSGAYFDGKAFMWQAGVITTLPDLPGFSNRSVALDINDHQQIAGWSNNGSDPDLATLWQFDSQGTASATGLLPCDTYHYSRAFGINNSGQVVGVSFDFFNTPGAATLWANGQTYDLNTLIPSDSGWNLMEALSINDYGQIVGLGSNNGSLDSFLLTPVPEPAAPPLLLAIVYSLRRQKPSPKPSSEPTDR
jgi:probable HAF family extracellular repeat protein